MNDPSRPSDFIIALAVYPQPVEALPALIDALGGPGRPVGVTRCELLGNDALAIEWDARRTATRIVMALIDVELQRFNGRRVTRLLTPLSIAVQAQIAAEGLHAPEIAPDRILEVLINAFE